MKILVVSNLYPPVVFGGYEILCKQMVEKLKTRGHKIRVLTSSFMADTTPPEEDIDRSLKLTTAFPKPGEQVGFVDFRLKTMHQVALYNYAATLRVIEAHTVNVIFCWCMNRLSLGPVFAAQKRNIPVCYTINDEHPKQFKYVQRVTSIYTLGRYFAEQWCWPMSTFCRLKPFPITIISEALKHSLIKQGTPVRMAQVIYQGIPLEQFPYQPLAKTQDTPCYLLYVGQLSRVKGVHTIFRSVGKITRIGKVKIQLDIVGSGVQDYEYELKKIAKEEGIGSYINFCGQIPHEKIAQVYHQHHILIFSSEWDEPFGLTHLEAMACGCAVVSTMNGGSAELIHHGENALAFQAGDAMDLSTKLLEMIRDEAERMAIIKNARALVEKHHSFDSYVRKIERFLNATVDGHR